MHGTLNDELRMRLSCLRRKAGLGRVPLPVMACAGIGFLVLLGFGVWHFWPSGTFGSDSDFAVVSSGGTEGNVSNASTVIGSQEGDEASLIAVDVEGAVKHPGLYKLKAGARIAEAVKAAGGLKKSASQGEVNLAQKLSDGEQVYIPISQGNSGSASAGGTGESGVRSDGKININRASSEELQQLSGVGESIAGRIIDYREANGNFKSVDDLTNVSGIGDARLAAIRDDICV